MTTKQKKRTEAERSMEENRRKKTFFMLGMEVLSMMLASAAIYGICFYKQTEKETILSYCVMAVLGIAVVGFHLRQQYINEELQFNNQEHIGRFWAGFLFGLCIAFLCSFLPVSGWPFVPVFIMLFLLSNVSVGIVSAGILLVLAVQIGGSGNEIFLLYFVSGVASIALFQRFRKEFQIGIPLFLSMFFLLVCETANIILIANERPNVELFLVPVSNIVISAIMLVGFLRAFSVYVVYKYRDRYLSLNDTENPTLVELKSKNRNDYMLSVHTVYFCERIGDKLKLDVDALKCAGYYHKHGEGIFEHMQEQEFPPYAQEILKEYLDKNTPITKKETVILLYSNAIVSTVMYMIAKNQDKNIDFEQVVEAVFKRLYDSETIKDSDITMRELKTMKKIFKEEKLYYDFLR